MTTPIQITDILIDAQAMHAAHKGTFYAPGRADLAAIKAGDHVKIGAILRSEHWTVGPEAERFWVKVTGVTATKITGEVDNNLVFSMIHKLKGGDVVEFDFSCVMDVLPKFEPTIN